MIRTSYAAPATATKRRRTRVLAAAAVVLLGPPAARAHELALRVRLAGGKVRVEALYPGDGAPARNARVTVSAVPDPTTGKNTMEETSGPPLASGSTSDEGLFFVAPPENTGLHVVVEDGLGHRAELEIPRETLAPLLLPEEQPSEASDVLQSERSGPLGDLPTPLAVALGLLALCGGTWLLRILSRVRGRRAP